MRCVIYSMPLCFVALLTLSACGDDSTMAPDRTTESEVEQVTALTTSTGRLALGVEGYTTPGEIRTGFIYDWAGAPMEITYEIHDGLAIWQGDIVLGPADQIATSTSQLPQSVAGPLMGPVTSNPLLRWPGGVIPYTITTANVDVVTEAIDILEDGTPGVTLVPHSGQANYVTFQDGGGCSSSIGMVGGQQFITLKVWDGSSWCPPGSGAHEILHSLGMYHEHSRCDRDSYVTIDYTYVESGKEHNFYKAGATSASEACTGAFDIASYDFGSIMHYPLDAFSTTGDNTINPIDPVPAGVTVGQRDQVGETDATTIDVLYGAFNAAPTVVLGSLASSYPEGSMVPYDASASTDADDDDDLLTFEWLFGDGFCSGGTPPAACADPAPGHVYADNGTYDYSVNVSDGFDAATGGGSMVIDNVAPDVDVGPDVTIDEGDELTRSGSFTDPGADTWTATVDYGDGTGTAPLALSGKSFNLAHTYVDNGVNPLVVTVTDDDGGVGSDEAEITVLNVPPTVDAGPDANVDSGEMYYFSGTFSDPGIEDDPWAWVIEWGFGPNTTGSTHDQSAPIEASRQVCVAGVYTVRLTVTDKDGGEGMDELTLTVPYIPVQIDIMPETDLNPVNVTKKGRLPVVILGSADFDVTQVDPSTLVLGDEVDPDTPVGQKNNGSYEAYLEDVNGDGMMDLITFFYVEDLVAGGDLDELSVELVLRGFLADGCTNIRGDDTVTPIT